MAFRWWAVIGILLPLLVNCAGHSTNQDGGDLTRAEVEYLSQRLSAAIEKKYPVLQHKKITHYVDSLGQYLVSHDDDMPPLPFSFVVLKTNEIFTLSLPGGKTYVTLGMIKALNYEGELAGAIAHELAHQQLAHALIAWRERVNAVRPSRYYFETDGDFADLFLGKNGYLWLGPGPEQEADELAPVILSHSKFDSRLYTSYLERIQQLERKQVNQLAVLLSLHPSTAERIAWAKTATLKVPPLRDARVSSPGFVEIKAILKNVEQHRDSRR